MYVWVCRGQSHNVVKNHMRESSAAVNVVALSKSINRDMHQTGYLTCTKPHKHRDNYITETKKQRNHKNGIEGRHKRNINGNLRFHHAIKITHEM